MSLSVKNMLCGSCKGLYAWKRRKAKALYLNGDECTDVTGGWSIGVHSVSDGLGEVTKNDTYVYLKTGSSVATDDCPIATNNPIDMNGYDNLCFKYENASGDGNMPVMWSVASSIRGISVKGFSDVTRSGSGENARGITSHIIKTNISSINSPLYAVGGISSSADSFPNGTANMVQAWIESSEEEYITDNNPDKYPDGAIHTDGYWYEKADEGLYVWKKYECIPKQTIVNPTFHIKANVSTQKAIVTSDDINFKAFGTITDSNNFYQSREPEFCNFMNGFKNSNSSVNFVISASTYSGQLELNYLNNSYWNAFTKMTPTDTGAELTASNLFKTTIDDTLQYTGTKTIATKIGEFISYIVSDKETAYPDGGEKGGYWYERVVEGAKVAHGSTTNWSNIEHKLGVKPTKILVAATGSGVVGGIYNDNENFVRMDDADTLQYHTGSFSNVNETTFSFSISNMYTSFTYYWIAIAE